MLGSLAGARVLDLYAGSGAVGLERVLARGPVGGRYDVVFADPPYALADTAVSQVLSLLADQAWLAPGALVIVERATRSGPVSWPDGFVPDKTRRYGEATFWYGLGPRGPKAPHNDQASP